MTSEKKYKSFEDFYPFYLSQHQNKICRVLHYIGSGLALCWLVLAVIQLKPMYLFYGLINGYTFAWLGHFFFEKNRPATFTYPWYSFIGDWRMLKDFLTKKH
ncbi:DUF962 domain-containing protein [Thalassotalea sp. M1531]|uniref:DUF962 domain-containing protein n=1 Tax=Thalassotalea algicola TaxID=2716224 RepID=A0A7Y0LFN4_9GAMM|nr:DUF962 domain-containing protein [Thalassotalea algicola]NMP33282.1 DUF962 domain-containing protein [Thalassotalea algicola]